MQQLLSLVGNRASEARMGVAERGNADSRQQIEVLAALGVVQSHALTADEGDRVSAVGLQHVARFARLNLFEGRG